MLVFTDERTHCFTYFRDFPMGCDCKIPKMTSQAYRSYDWFHEVK